MAWIVASEFLMRCHDEGLRHSITVTKHTDFSATFERCPGIASQLVMSK